MRVREEGGKAEEERRAGESRELRHWPLNHHAHQGLERGQAGERRRLDDFLHHGGGGVPLDDGLARARRVVIVADGVEKFLEVEILVLERVRQLVRQHHFLHVFAHPIRD